MLLLLRSSSGGGGSAPPSIVVGWTKSTLIVNATTVTVTAPATVAGDVIYIAVVQDALGTITCPGFTALYTVSLTGFGGERFAVLYKTASASEPATYTLTSTLLERWVWLAFAVRNHGGHEATSTPTTGSSASATVPSVTSTSNNALILVVVGTDNISLPHGIISGYTEIDSAEIASGGALSAQYKLKATAGVESGNAVPILTEQWGAVSWVVAPIATSGGSTYTLTAEQGSFALSGITATFRIARRVVAVPASLLVAGLAATLTRTYKVSAQVGALALTGTATNFKRSYRLVASPMSLAFTGQDATLVFGDISGYTLSVLSVCFAFYGQAASFRITRRLSAVPQTFTLIGQSIGMITARRLIAVQSVYAVSGQVASFRVKRVLVAASGVFVLVGQDADLSWSAYVMPPTPPERTFTVAAGVRMVTVAYQDRTFVVGAENRTLVAPPDDRYFGVAAERRDFVLA
jgi:hypothetical protein